MSTRFVNVDKVLAKIKEQVYADKGRLFVHDKTTGEEVEFVGYSIYTNENAGGVYRRVVGHTLGAHALNIIHVEDLEAPTRKEEPKPGEPLPGRLCIDLDCGREMMKSTRDLKHCPQLSDTVIL